MIKKLVLILLLLLGGVRITFGEDSWKEYRSQYFYIYYKEAPREFVKTVSESAEDYYVKVTENLGFFRYKGWYFEDRAVIFIYDDRDDFIESHDNFKWSNGIADTKHKIIKTFPSAHGFFDTVLPHELGHIIFREFIGHFLIIPLWFEEGVAMYQEKGRRWGANKIVLKAIENGSFMSLSELHKLTFHKDTDQKLLELFYAESASVVYYLITEFGKHRFVMFCRKLKEGAGFEASLNVISWRFKTIDDLNEAWVKYLKKQKK